MYTVPKEQLVPGCVYKAIMATNIYYYILYEGHLDNCRYVYRNFEHPGTIVTGHFGNGYVFSTVDLKTAKQVLEVLEEKVMTYETW